MVQSEVDINYYMCGFMVTCHCSSLCAILSHARCTQPTALYSDSWLIIVINRCSAKYFLTSKEESDIKSFQIAATVGLLTWKKNQKTLSVAVREVGESLWMYFCVLLCTYIRMIGRAAMTEVMGNIIYISNVVNVVFVLHVYVDACPLFGSD